MKVIVDILYANVLKTIVWPVDIDRRRPQALTLLFNNFGIGVACWEHRSVSELVNVNKPVIHYY